MESVPKDFVTVEGVTSAAENNLRTKPPKHHAKPGYKTQEKAFRINTATHLEKSAGWRFESSPVHQIFQSHTGKWPRSVKRRCSGNCSGLPPFPFPVLPNRLIGAGHP